MNQKTAILVFANSIQEELKNKAIIGGKALFSELNQKTILTAQRTGLPFFVYTEKEQRGHTFGERFVNAIQDVYDRGYENVITIGNDTPHLTKQHLIESVKQLENNKFVLGPSKDGGFYLMGLHKSQFNIDVFLKLPWQSRTLSKCISRLIKTAKIELVTLEILIDIDTISDIESISRFFRTLSVHLKKIIKAILNSKVVIQDTVTELITSLHTNYFFNKGPPFVSFQ
ncbi:DUF2064 domain-containing protein [Aquimarina sp. AD10]|uniref:TIGR04282 family arsenosugar biosynthesis glycosyltransferase n=1 Tax=Aquimarina TaxID=290174 RepID=UPI000E49E034|nr:MULTISPECIES: DUF2064 domain-containing protein [Aquimarina]AXT62543.1 DUF2064 domain-containing protein [Aquimarina sp. AD10]RKM90265.1 DUF2064 domain-containing protein [Aquimarina sp. AD10]